MRIQIDTSLKTIKLESTEKLVDVIRMIKKLLPDKEWEKYTLQTNTTITNWCNHYTHTYNPFYGGGGAYSLNNGFGGGSLGTSKTVYNLELKADVKC